MGRKKVDKSRIEKGIKKEEKTFALMAKKIVDSIKDEKELRAFAKISLEILYKDNPNLFADHAKLKLNKK
jgi:urease gamma subunit